MSLRSIITFPLHFLDRSHDFLSANHKFEMIFSILTNAHNVFYTHAYTHTVIPGGTISHPSKQIIYVLFTVYFYVNTDGFRRFEIRRIHGTECRNVYGTKIEIFGVETIKLRVFSLSLLCFGMILNDTHTELLSVNVTNASSGRHNLIRSLG